MLSLHLVKWEGMLKSFAIAKKKRKKRHQSGRPAKAVAGHSKGKQGENNMQDLPWVVTRARQPETLSSALQIGRRESLSARYYKQTREEIFFFFFLSRCQEGKKGKNRNYRNAGKKERRKRYVINNDGRKRAGGGEERSREALGNVVTYCVYRLRSFCVQLFSRDTWAASKPLGIYK